MSVRTLFLVVFRPQSAAPPHWGLFIPDQPLIIQQFNHATPGKLIHIDGIPGVGFRPCASRGYVPARGRTAMHPFFIGQLAGQHVINGVPGSKGITAIDIIEDLAFKLPAMGSDPVSDLDLNRVASN